ncbi:transposase [Geminicoccus flavidas]
MCSSAACTHTSGIGPLSALLTSLRRGQLCPVGRDRLPAVATGGGQARAPTGADLREMLNAIRHMARSGGGWRALPKDFPPSHLGPA